jgi:hypothetical protein
MPSWAEAGAAWEGMKRLLRFDPSFAQWFDRSPAGALRSFGLALPVLPCFLVLSFFGVSLRPELGLLHVAGAMASGYVLSWVMFPLLLIAVGRAIEREGHAISAIGFYNWFGTFYSFAVTAFYILAVIGVFGALASPLFYLLRLSSLVYEVFALRALMGVGFGGAFLLTLLDFVLGLSLNFLLLSPLYQPLLPA